MSNYRKKVNLILLFTFSFLSVFWVVSAQNSFCFDDISLLLTVSTSSYEEIFSFWPYSAYADRPVGVIFVKLLYDIAGLDYGRFHVVLVLIHLCNVYFVFLMARHIFERKYKDNEKCFLEGIISAAFFGIWTQTHMAVQWVAAIYDLLGTFWSLLSILFYLQYRRRKEYRGQNLVFFVFFYYLAIRTKEMFLILPMLLAVYEIWEMYLDRKKRHFTACIFVSLFLFLVFFGRILYCKAQGSITNDVNNPYYQSLNPVRMIQNLLKYCMMCFDLENIGWDYVFSISGLTGTILICMGFLIAFWKAVAKRKIELLLCYIAVGISIVIVLPMIHQVHALYLYFPSIFIGLLLACMVSGLHGSENVSVIMMCLLLASVGSNRAVGTKNYWIENAKIEKAAWDDIEKMKPPVPDSTIYIKNTDGVEYTPFFYGEGGVCKLLYHDQSLSVQVLEKEEDVEYSIPYVLWNYQDGRLHEVERNENRELWIADVYQYPQEDGSLILGIVTDKINGIMTVYIDGNEQAAIVGDDFLSVQIPDELLRGKKSIRVKVKDQYGTVSEDYLCVIGEEKQR